MEGKKDRRKGEQGENKKRKKEKRRGTSVIFLSVLQSCCATSFWSPEDTDDKYAST